MKLPAGFRNALLGMVIAPSLAIAQDPLLPDSGPLHPEHRLVNAIELAGASDLDAAVAQLQALSEDLPDFRLATLYRQVMEATRAGTRAELGTDAQALDGLLAEADKRIHGRAFTPGDRLPAPAVALSSREQHLIAVDTRLSRLFLYRRDAGGQLVLVSDHYVSIGANGVRKQVEGDRRTPLGIYFITGRLPGEGLPDRYGPLALPVDYPNAWDRRAGRSGYGIWLHGEPSDTYSRPPLASDGCVSMPDPDLLFLDAQVEPGRTAVIIGEGFDWIEPEVQDRRRRELLDQLVRWRDDWGSMDLEAYLSHYDGSFQGKGMDLATWRDHKARVNAGKSWIQVGVSDVTILEHPDEPGVMMTRFVQDYRSDDYTSRDLKELYWARAEDGAWRIVSEGEV